ncbi:putative MPP superfamily phosphohydrolase [Rubrivivax gelatinosus]|uniref:metallophosphoesterase n=2 Tax=Rubrivivax gelatinosus TaxID=28068 RepID=UPI0018CA2061|nr:metallophosphoesterase [Rubrivivax gelatinosus]MBG6082160.1 putative MPP superfamily phosphohydrolase [Rubrivivax gelatinosus]
MRFVALIALLHALLVWRLAAPLPLAGVLAVVAVAALSTALIPMSFAGRRGRDRAVADRWSWAGFIAMGHFAIVFALVLLREAWLLAAAGLGWAPQARDSALVVLLLAPLLTLVAIAGARRTPKLRTVRVPLPGLPPALEGFTIVQISDLHVGPTIKRGWVQAVVERANAAGADLVALTGDLVDGRVEDLREDFAPLAALRARHGVFAVTGNHDYYSGALPWIAEWRRCGIVPLIDEHHVVVHGGAQLAVAGVADFGAAGFEPSHRSDAQRALAGAPPGATRLLLAHQPRSAAAAAEAGADLQLSGHTHGGQIWPWGLLVPLQQPITAGLQRVGRMRVYVSRGTGYWGPPLRLGAPSEITRLVLVREAGR